MEKSLLRGIYPNRGEEVYTSVDDELEQTLTSAAIIDRSFLGRIDVTGRDRLDLLHRLSTNDLLRLQPGELAPTVFTTDKGRVVDYVHTLAAENIVHLITSAGSENRLVGWIEKYHIMEDISFSIQTGATAMYTIIGPRSADLVLRLLSTDLSCGHHTFIRWRGIPLCLVHVQEFDTHQFNIILPVEEGESFWAFVVEQAAVATVPMLGTRAYVALKCLLGIPSSGAELSELFNPYEAGLRCAISFTKGCYIGQEVIARLDTYRKIQRQLVAILFETTFDSSHDSPVLFKEGEEVGLLTTMSNTAFRGSYPALGIIRKESALQGGIVEVQSSKAKIRGKIVTVFDRSS